MTKQTLKIVQWMGLLGSLTSKYLLSISSTYGRPLAIIGYIFVFIFNSKKQGMQIIMTLVAGLGLLSVYGRYKRVENMPGLQTGDIIIITITSIFCIFLAYKQYQQKNKLRLRQIIASTLSIMAFLLIGLQSNYGRISLFIAHCTLCYIYYKKEGYIFVGLNALSALIAITKII